MTSDYADYKYFSSTLYDLQAIECSISALIKQVGYLTDEEKQQLITCCFFAARAHDGQKRRSGEPYICHPIKVAQILAKEALFDLAVLEAAVLHDVIEDTETEKATVAHLFSEEVANLVDGVSKLEKSKQVSVKELQARTFEKLVVATVADPRVVMIKFADRMHNMQTLQALRPDKRQRIAHETLEVYVPIAERLGMFNFKTELEELAFKSLYPWRYKVIKRLIKDNKVREDCIAEVTEVLTGQLKQAGINASLRKRKRNLYHVYQKLEKNRGNRRRPLQNASIPFILITDSTEDCYRALYIIHQYYTPVANTLVDFIASPKVNGYRSLHTSVRTKNRYVVNFQIRTKEMHNIAESGLIAIWRKENSEESDLAQDKSIRRWLRNLMSMTGFTDSPIEYYEAVKRDLVSFDIQVFTPTGEAIALPSGATVIDFAYHIHSNLGNHLVKAKVNDITVPPQYKLSDGQTVEIFTGTEKTPKSKWLKHAKTARARNAIRHFLRSLPQEDLAKFGFTEMESYLSKRGLSYYRLAQMLEQIANNHYKISRNELLQKIALRDIKRRSILMDLQRIANQHNMPSRINIRVLNRLGVLATIAETIALHKANILRIDFPKNTQTEEIVMKFEIHTELPTQLHDILGALKTIRFVQSVHCEEIQL